jgi:hypothetical protein
MKKSMALALAPLLAAAAVSAQQAPAVRPLGKAAGVSKADFGANVWVRHLANGSVLVNDIANRRVVMLDSTMTSMTVVADSTPATGNAYSGRAASLVAYRGDSTLFVDPSSLTMLVIDPQGTVGRTMALPRSQDAMMLGNSMIGGAAFDGTGIVYRTMNFQRMMMGMRPGQGGAPQAPQMPDSTPIVRVNLATRSVDTLDQIKVPQMKMDIQRDENGRVNISMIANPLPTVDDWAVLSDGSIALVRGRDYHIDFIRPDGTRESAPKLPFEWRRLSDEDKVAFMDSVKVQRERLLAQMDSADAARGVERGGGIARGVPGNGQGGAPGGGQGRGPAGQGGGPPGAGGRVMIEMAPGGAGGAGNGGPMPMGGRNMQFVPANELPDYQPVFFAGAARADGDGNLWIRTVPTKSVPGGPIYDVVNGKGELIDRVQLPADRVIIGFGKGGVVYLTSQSGQTRAIERATIR